MKQLAIFDNNGETLDRFTIINMNDGEMYGASEHPFYGFGQYCGNPDHSYFSKTIGSQYMNNLAQKDPNHYKRIIKRKTAEIVNDFKEGGNIGVLVDYECLPDDVKQYCKQIIS